MDQLVPATAIIVWFAQAALGAELGPLIEQCDGCHGTDGVSQWTDVPTIAGISEFVHSEALFLYQEDGRPCSSSKFRSGDTEREATDMCAVSKPLTEVEIEDLAAYYADKPFAPAKQEFDAALAARGRTVHDEACELCHTDGGSNAEDDSSLLKGQWIGYMRQTLSDYRSGERDQPERMKAKLDPLSDDDIEALIHFYASPN